jgi:hypothetical protein
MSQLAKDIEQVAENTDPVADDTDMEDEDTAPIAVYTDRVVGYIGQ